MFSLTIGFVMICEEIMEHYTAHSDVLLPKCQHTCLCNSEHNECNIEKEEINLVYKLFEFKRSNCKNIIKRLNLYEITITTNGIFINIEK